MAGKKTSFAKMKGSRKTGAFHFPDNLLRPISFVILRINGMKELLLIFLRCAQSDKI